VLTRGDDTFGRGGVFTLTRGVVLRVGGVVTRGLLVERGDVLTFGRVVVRESCTARGDETVRGDVEPLGVRTLGGVVTRGDVDGGVLFRLVRTVGLDSRSGARDRVVVVTRGDVVLVVARGVLAIREVLSRVDRIVVPRSRPVRCGKVTERVGEVRPVGVVRVGVVPRAERTDSFERTDGDVAVERVVPRGDEDENRLRFVVDVRSVARDERAVADVRSVARPERTVGDVRSVARAERAVDDVRSRVGVGATVPDPPRTARALRTVLVELTPRLRSTRATASDVSRIAACGSAADRVRADRTDDAPAVRAVPPRIERGEACANVVNPVPRSSRRARATAVPPPWPERSPRITRRGV
jgi:hypothetical protein